MDCVVVLVSREKLAPLDRWVTLDPMELPSKDQWDSRDTQEFSVTTVWLGHREFLESMDVLVCLVAPDLRETAENPVVPFSTARRELPATRETLE